MPYTKLNAKDSGWANLVKVVAAMVFCAGCLTVAAAQQAGQKAFTSPEQASAALYAAAGSNDEKAMLEIFGPDGRRIVASGDEAEDAHNRAMFAERYKQMHRLVKEPDGSYVLYIGAENWPTPIPIVNRSNGWYFDTNAGKREILYRRIGRNEVSAIRVCEELVPAQTEYFSGKGEYAQRFSSTAGEHNGLYWETSQGTPQSPIGPLVAAAESQGNPNNSPTPYRGYYYRILTSQGSHAPGGAKSYLVDGKMTGGFAFLAYPAEYRSSGVMTFIVGQDGVVYQKDLGKKTTNVAREIKSYDPGPGWRKAEERVPSEQATK